MSFPESVRVSVLIKCKRHCCLCGNYAGINMELHHIKQQADGGLDTEENCIPLCFNCHVAVKSYNPHHPKGLKYTEKELVARRDEIYNMVKESIVDIYNDSDIMKAKNFMDMYYKILEYLIKVDSCGSRVDIGLIITVNEMISRLNSYEYVFENIGLDQEKCALSSILTEWNSIVTNKRYFHEIDNGMAVCFNGDTVDEYHDKLTELRNGIVVSYLKFRSAATMRNT